MTIEEFVKSLTYDQKRELLWALFYDACEMSRSTEDMTPYLTDSPTPMFSKSSQECGVSIGRKST